MPSMLGTPLMNANRFPLRYSCGHGWPSNFRRAGFSSKRSSWLGDPAMCR